MKAASRAMVPPALITRSTERSSGTNGTLWRSTIGGFAHSNRLRYASCSG